MVIKKMKIEGKLSSSKDLEVLISNLTTAKATGATVTLMIDKDYDDFCSDIGRYAVKSEKYQKQLEQYFLNEDDEKIYLFIGRMLLDELIPSTYYVRDDRNLVVYTIK